ncbi:MAG TPA: hypothetical protein VNU20_03925 [Candidatus Sulfotelmatobacter sp.]|nr:hypothetical protein [Candidatus Sulfotelmatobacter sp.]
MALVSLLVSVLLPKLFMLQHPRHELQGIAFLDEQTEDNPVRSKFTSKHKLLIGKENAEWWI